MAEILETEDWLRDGKSLFGVQVIVIASIEFNQFPFCLQLFVSFCKFLVGPFGI